MLSVKTIDKKTITVTGNIGDISLGVLYAFTCNWEKSKYGLQFRCLDASVAYDDIKSKEQIIAYLSSRLFEGIGEVMARKIYDKFGSRLLEGNVRSFLSTKVAVNKKIRGTILNNPKMFFAFNNGISATAMDVEIENTNHGKFITFVRDFQIINGGQTTASISNARYKDKADLSSIFVQMKLTSIDESTSEESDELIRNTNFALIKAIRIVLNEGLRLLGIAYVDEM